MRLFRFVCLLAVLACTGEAAYADTIDNFTLTYSVTGLPGDVQSATFSILDGQQNFIADQFVQYDVTISPEPVSNGRLIMTYSTSGFGIFRLITSLSPTSPVAITGAFMGNAYDPVKTYVDGDRLFAAYFIPGTYTLVQPAVYLGDARLPIASASFTITQTYIDPTPTTVTPEPASLIMVGSGLIGIGGLLRRSFGRTSAKSSDRSRAA
ncbi:hypothetical protein BH10ACI4_BH10ACI4_28470 [soil metagenome]